MEFVQEILNRRAMEAALADSLMPEEINEDWQLSQFWYSTETSISLANEALKNTSIACVSCPSIHTQLLNLN